MIIQELFQKIVKESEDDFIKYYLQYDKNISSYEDIKKLLNDICECKVKEVVEDDIVFSLPDVGDLGADSFLIKLADLEKKDFEKYAYELCPINEILGYQVSEACLRYPGEFLYAASILFEMTFFGYSIKKQKKNVKKEKKILDKRIKECKEDNLKYTTLTELLKKYNIKDERKPFEKKFDLNKLKIEGKFQRELLKELIKLEKEYRRIEKND